MTRADELRALARKATMSAFVPAVRRSAKAELDAQSPKLATDLAAALEKIERLEAALRFYATMDSCANCLIAMDEDNYGDHARAALTTVEG